MRTWKHPNKIKRLRCCPDAGPACIRHSEKVLVKHLRHPYFLVLDTRFGLMVALHEKAVLLPATSLLCSGHFRAAQTQLVRISMKVSAWNSNHSEPSFVSDRDTSVHVPELLKWLNSKFYALDEHTVVRTKVLKWILQHKVVWTLGNNISRATWWCQLWNASLLPEL